MHLLVSGILRLQGVLGWYLVVRVMVTGYLAKDLTVLPVSLAVMKYMVSEVAGWVRWECVTTDAITFIWIKLVDIKSVVEMCNGRSHL